MSPDLTANEKDVAVSCEVTQEQKPKGATQILAQWKLSIKRTAASGVSVMTHSTEEELWGKKGSGK